MPQERIIGYEPLPPDIAIGGPPDIRSLVDQKAAQYGVNPSLARAVAQMESNFDPKAISPKGAIGPMQLMPGTARQYGADPSDPVQNVDAGMRYLRDLSKQYGGDQGLTLAAYNAGPGAVEKYGGVPPYPETQKYVAKGTKAIASQVQAAKERIIGYEPLPGESTAPSVWDEAKRLLSIAATSSGAKTAEQVLGGYTKATLDALVGNTQDPQTLEKLKTGVSDLVGGIRDEPYRMWQELSKSGEAITRGDINEAANHLWYSIPFAGAAGAGMAEYLKNGDIKGAFSHAIGTLAPVAAHPVIAGAQEAVEALPGVVEKAKVAIPAAVKAAAPDVAKGAAKVGVGYGASYLPIPGPVKYGLGIPSAGAGAKQIVGGLQKGMEAGRAALAERVPPAAPPPPPPPPPGPPSGPLASTGLTDEALSHLYATETDPLKRSALQSELADRGLIDRPGAAPVAPEANPYRGYSQSALQSLYKLERNPQKLALIEQSARNRNLTLFNREGRRATTAVPETGFTEPRGPSLTQDEANMLRNLGEQNPFAASPETIGIARQMLAEQPQGAISGATPPAAAPPVEPPTPTPAPPAAEAVAPAPSAPAAAPVAITPELLEAIAKDQVGKSFKRMAADDPDRARVLALAQRITQPAPPEAPPPPQPGARIDIGPSVPAGKSIGQQLDEELAARRQATPPAAAEPAAPPAAPPGAPPAITGIEPPSADPGYTPEFINHFAKWDTGRLANFVFSHESDIGPTATKQLEAMLRERGWEKSDYGNFLPPKAPAAAAPPAAAPAAETIAPATETTPVVPKRTGEEATAYNRGNKVQPFVDFLRQAGYTSADAEGIERGRWSPSQIGSSEQPKVTPRWGNITDALIEKGVLKKGVKEPSALTVKQIINKLKEGEPPPPNALQAAVTKNKATVAASKAKLTPKAKTAPVETPPMVPTPEMARQILDEEVAVPEGWYVHGRSGGPELNQNWPVQLTRDIPTASGYAGEKGSVWMVREKPTTRVADFTAADTADMDRFIKSLRPAFLKRSPATEAYRQTIADSRGVDVKKISFTDFAEHVRDDFTPTRIVHSAQAFDNDTALNLLEHYPGGWPSMVKTPDGAIVIPGELGNVETVNLSHLASGAPGAPPTKK